MKKRGHKRVSGIHDHTKVHFHTTDKLAYLGVAGILVIALLSIFLIFSGMNNNNNKVLLGPQGKTYYVGVTGCSDSSIEATNPQKVPWCSLERAFNESAHASMYAKGGDSVYLRGGVYRLKDLKGLGIDLTLDSTADNPTLISAYPGEKVEIYLSELVNSSVVQWKNESNWFYFNWTKYLEDKYGPGNLIVPQQIVLKNATAEILLSQLSVNEMGASGNLPEQKLSYYLDPSIKYYNSTLFNSFLFNNGNIGNNSQTGLLFIIMPTGKNITNYQLEIGLNKSLKIIGDNVIFKNISIKYGGQDYANKERFALEVLGRNITLENLNISKNAWGAVEIGACTNCEIKNSEISSNGHSGIAVIVSSNVSIFNNTLNSNNYRNYNVVGTIVPSGIYGNIDQEIIIESNKIFNMNGSGIFGDAIINESIVNNIIGFVNGSGLRISNSLIRSQELYILNNLFMNSSTGILLGNLGVSTPSINNNIFSNNNVTINSTSNAAFNSNNNILYSSVKLKFGINGIEKNLSEWNSWLFDLNSIVEDPKVVDKGNGNYMPTASKVFMRKGLKIVDGSNGIVNKKDIRGYERGNIGDIGPYQMPQIITIVRPKNGENISADKAKTMLFSAGSQVYINNAQFILNGGTLTPDGLGTNVYLNYPEFGGSEWADGEYTLQIYGENITENLADIAEVTFYKDSKYPNITGISPSNSRVFMAGANGKAEVSYSLSAVDDRGIANLTLNNGTNLIQLVDGQNYKANVSVGSNYAWTFSAIDTAGNVNTTTVRFSVTNAPYNYVAPTRADGNISEDRNVTINVSIVSPVAGETVEITLYNRSGVLMAPVYSSELVLNYHSLTVNELPNGYYFFNATVRNISGDIVGDLGRRDITIGPIPYSIDFGVSDGNGTIKNQNKIDVVVNVAPSNVGPSNITIRLYNGSKILLQENKSINSVPMKEVHYTGLSDGIYYFNVTVEIAGQVINSETRQVTINSSYGLPPGPVYSVDVVVPDEDAYYNENPLILKVVLSEPGKVNFTLDNWETNYTMDSSSDNKTFKYNLSDYSSGEFIFRPYIVFQNISGGKISNIKVNFTLDYENPSIDIYSPTNKTYTYTQKNVSINFSVSDSYGIKSKYFIRDGVKMTYTSPTYYNANSGNHTYVFYAEDYAGNVATETIKFTINPLSGSGSGGTGGDTSGGNPLGSGSGSGGTGGDTSGVSGSGDSGDLVSGGGSDATGDSNNGLFGTDTAALVIKILMGLLILLIFIVLIIIMYRMFGRKDIGSGQNPVGGRYSSGPAGGMGSSYPPTYPHQSSNF